MKGKKRVHAFKNRMEHWQVVSIGLTVYDAIAMILAFFMALWFRFDCRYTMIPKEYLNFYFKFALNILQKVMQKEILFMNLIQIIHNF